MNSPFGRYLSDALKRKGWTQAQYAAKIGYSQPGVQRILAGVNRFPLKHMDTWLRVFGDAVDAKTFRELALLTRAPAEIRDLVQRQKEELERVKRRKKVGKGTRK
jgi:transcriptional regulator with XRE-family HTH domain